METVIVAFENNKNALRVKEILEEDGAADCLVCRTPTKCGGPAASSGCRWWCADISWETRRRS